MSEEVTSEKGKFEPAISAALQPIRGATARPTEPASHRRNSLRRWRSGRMKLGPGSPLTAEVSGARGPLPRGASFAQALLLSHAEARLRDWHLLSGPCRCTQARVHSARWGCLA